MHTQVDIVKDMKQTELNSIRDFDIRHDQLFPQTVSFLLFNYL